MYFDCLKKDLLLTPVSADEVPVWKLPLALLAATLAFAESFAGPILQPPRFDEFPPLPPYNLFLSPDEVEVPRPWLDFCPPMLFTGLEPPEPWGAFAPLMFEEGPAQLVAPLESEDEPENPELIGAAPQAFEFRLQSLEPAPVPLLAAPEIASWVFIVSGFALLALCAVPRRVFHDRFRFSR